MNIFERFFNYWNCWRGKGKCRMEHRLWLVWALTGRYPRAS
jgi:hypothetical protein